MDGNDFHRRFGGFGRRPFDRSDRFFDDFRDMDSVFVNVHDDIRKHMEDMHRHMEESFRGFRGHDFHNEFAIKDSPRNYMLKEPDTSLDVPARRSRRPFFDSFSLPRWDSYGRGRDSDLDDVIDEKSVSKLFDERRHDDGRGQPQVSSWSKSYSMSRVFDGGNNKIEEKRTVLNPDGTEETEINRRLNDKSHTVVTKTDKYGRQETNSTLNNMDERDLPTFQADWNQTNRGNDVPSSSGDEMMLRQRPSFFDRFFRSRS